MFGLGFWEDVRNFMGMLLLVFFIPIVFMGGLAVSKYLICDIAKSCEVRK